MWKTLAKRRISKSFAFPAVFHSFLFSLLSETANKYNYYLLFVTVCLISPTKCQVPWGNELFLYSYQQLRSGSQRELFNKYSLDKWGYLYSVGILSIQWLYWLLLHRFFCLGLFLLLFTHLPNCTLMLLCRLSSLNSTVVFIFSC